MDDRASLSTQKNPISFTDCRSPSHKRSREVSARLGSFHSILFRNQRIFRAVHAVKIAPRHKPSNRNINYKDTALLPWREGSLYSH